MRIDHKPREECQYVHVDWNVNSIVVVCLTSQQHAGVSQGRICTDNCTCCYTDIEVADPTFYLTQSQYTDTGPTSQSTDPIMPGRVATGVPILSHWYDSTRKKSHRKRDSNPGSSASEADALTTRPTRWSCGFESTDPRTLVSAVMSIICTDMTWDLRSPYLSWLDFALLDSARPDLT